MCIRKYDGASVECLYAPDLREDTKELTLVGEEFIHCKALRLHVSSRVILTNGQGLCAVASLGAFDKNGVKAQVIEVLKGYAEIGKKFGLALGILDNRERMEFAVEKAVELGITDFFPLACQRSQKTSVPRTRLEAKILAAVKQSRRSVLPKLHLIMTVKQFLETAVSAFDTLVIADTEGTSETPESSSVVIAVGPEGGFSPEENALLRSNPQCRLLRLAPRRLRSETAVIAACAVVASAW